MRVGCVFMGESWDLGIATQRYNAGMLGIEKVWGTLNGTVTDLERFHDERGFSESASPATKMRTAPLFIALD